ncbi:MAG: hypothetical protein ACOC2U_01000 [bacterium]
MKIFCIYFIVIFIVFGCNNNSTQINDVKPDSTELIIPDLTLKNSIQSLNLMNNKVNDSILIEKIEIEKTNNHIDTFKMRTKNFNNKTLLKTDSLENEIIFNELKKYCLSCDTIAINKQLPYGSKKLINHKFPAEGFVFYKNVDSMSNQNQNSFIKILDFFVKEVNYFEGSNTHGLIPVVTQYEKLTLSRNSLEDIFKNINFSSISFPIAYRFPNMGVYHVYCTFRGFGPGGITNIFPDMHVDKYYHARKLANHCSAMLVLYNPKTHFAYYLIAFSTTDFNTFDSKFRFFYITKDKKILIYEGKSIRQKDIKSNEYIDEYKITLNKTHVISVDTNNEIVIENLNNNEH